MEATTTTLGAITPGEVTTAGEGRPWVNNEAGFCVGDFGWDEDMGDVINAEALANAALYVDAHNTAQKTGKLPSQLKQDVDELAGALRNAIRILDEDMDYRPDDVAAGEFADIKLILSKYPKP